MGYVTRVSSSGEAKQFHYKWGADLQWNTCMSDADAAFAQDPNGTYIGLLDDKPIATLTGLKYGQDYGFIGLYITDQDYRGKGYGKALWDVVLKYVAENDERTVGLDGVVEQQHNYKKEGFEHAFKMPRYEFDPKRVVDENKSLVSSITIKLLSQVSFDNVVEYDARHFESERRKFLEQFTKNTTFVAVDGDRVVGYVTVRKGETAYRIGPLFADDKQIANELLVKICEHIPEKVAYIDIPDANSDAGELIKKYGLKSFFECARMYRPGKGKKAPQLPWNEIYAIASCEHG
jgi:GNAT superfamily N-acetyltransferase